MPDLVLAPIRLVPRLDPKPWGGRRLERFGLRLPRDEPIGEALATAPQAVVADGPSAGRTLAEIVAENPEQVLGQRGLAATGGRPLFPLLVKLIDAVEDLSVQVHPADAAAPPDRLGKTEVYHVLDAAPGAVLGLGLLPGVSDEAFAAACRTGGGAAGKLVRWLPAVPGESILIPAGTVHALGGGGLVYELQQPSDVTYRLDDWGRLDAAGRPRELHVEHGLAVLDPTSRPEPIPPLRFATGAGRRQLLAACRPFALERIALAAGERVEVVADGSPQTLTCLHGRVEVATAAGITTAAAGETVVLAAAAPPAGLVATAPAVVLRGWVPDLRAEVVVPARATGHADDAIAALAGPLPDVWEALSA